MNPSKNTDKPAAPVELEYTGKKALFIKLLYRTMPPGGSITVDPGMAAVLMASGKFKKADRATPEPRKEKE